MFCTKCGHKIDQDSKFCTKCGHKIGGDIEDNLYYESGKKLNTKAIIKKIFVGKRMYEGFNIPDKKKLEKRVWYRLLKVVLFVSIFLSIIGGIVAVFGSYDNLTSCHYSYYSDDWYGSCMSGGPAFLLSMLNGVLLLYGLIIFINIIRLIFHYIVYGKK